jgi:hypothetical protein
VEVLDEAEHKLGLALVREYRKVVPEAVRDWQQETRGLGEHLLARLLGRIGHPVHTRRHHWEGDGKDRTLVDDGPYVRRVSDLLSYCGHGDPARRRRRGMTAEEGFALGDPVAKSLVHLLAESCVKQVGTATRAPSPYRLVYNDARARYEDKEHEEPCPPCGPPGKPAQPGSRWSLKHQHMASLRLVGKAILTDPWREAGGSEQKRPCGECAALIPIAAVGARNAARDQAGCRICIGPTWSALTMRIVLNSRRCNGRWRASPACERKPLVGGTVQSATVQIRLPH